MSTKSTPNTGKIDGAPIEAVMIVQKMPNTETIAAPQALSSEGPRPGLTLFIVYILLAFL